MTEERIIETTARPEHVTVINERGGSGMGGIMIALIALVLRFAIAFFAINSSQSKVDPSDASIAAAADKVGGAAEKIGNAAEEAVKKIN